MEALREQAGIMPSAIRPSCCDHPLCGFHATFIAENGALRPLNPNGGSERRESTARDNREYVARHWKRKTYKSEPYCCKTNAQMNICSLDDFLQSAEKHSFTLSAMAFQDAMNLDIERLVRCSLHVYDKGHVVPFCGRYLTALKS
jgi:hypothetical protein